MTGIASLISKMTIFKGIAILLSSLATGALVYNKYSATPKVALEEAAETVIEDTLEGLLDLPDGALDGLIDFNRDCKLPQKEGVQRE